MFLWLKYFTILHSWLWAYLVIFKGMFLIFFKEVC